LFAAAKVLREEKLTAAVRKAVESSKGGDAKSFTDAVVAGL